MSFIEEAKWRQRIKVVPALTSMGTMYYLVDEDLNFIQPIKNYLDMIAIRATSRVSSNTMKTYCYLLWYYIVYLSIIGISVYEVDGHPELLASFHVWLKNQYRFYHNVSSIETKSNLNTTTINAIIGQVSALYRYLEGCNKITNNPVIFREVVRGSEYKDRDMLAHTRHGRYIQKNALVSRVPKKEPRTINLKSFKYFLDATYLLRDKVILLILKEGGLRSGELLGLHLEDIDFAQEGIWVKFRPDNINHSRSKCGCGRDRFVHLPRELIILIDKYISSEWLRCNADNDFLFTVVNARKKIHNGCPMKKTTLDSIFRHYSKVIGSHVTPHMLRHTHATELAREYIERSEPINWKFISQRLGHSSVSTTSEIYTHLTKEDYKHEYARLNKK